MNFVSMTSALPSSAAFAAFQAFVVFLVWYSSNRNAPIIAPKNNPIIVPIIGMKLRAIAPSIAPIIVPIRACFEQPPFLMLMSVIIHSSISPESASTRSHSSVIGEIAVDHVIRS